MNQLLAQTAIAQINMHVGNFEQNKQKIIQFIDLARVEGKRLVVFPELTVCGYPPRDFLEFDDFVLQCKQVVEDVVSFTKGITVVIGFPEFNNAPQGKRLFNSAAIIQDQAIIGFAHKTLLPNYDVFDEYRYFEPNLEFEVFEIEGEKVGITICEDIWNVLDEQLYQIDPIKELKDRGATTIINISASPFSVAQQEKRIEVLRTNVTKHQVQMIYANCAGAQTELIFDGGSVLMDSNANIQALGSYFKEELVVAKQISQHKLLKEEAIFNALVIGVRDYFNKLGFQKALVGLSGGIDSALTYAVAVNAIGVQNVLGVLMPSQYSSDHSINDAKMLVNNYGGEFEILEIEGLYKSYASQLEPLFKGTKPDVTEENLQARIRGVLLMAISNKFGNILLNTSNKSEAAVGYGTLYGDMCGGLAVLGDVYKTDVFAISRWVNRNRELIPNNTIVKPPSAELRPDQKDSDSLPDYDILDTILLEYVENRKGPKQLIEMGFDKKEVNRILKMVNLNEHKRYQTPPILRVSDKAFGMGRRLPIVAKYLA